MAPTGRIRARHEPGQVRFHVHGRACADLAPALRRFAEAALARGVASVRVDLSGCEHFDSTFIGTLLCLRKQALGRGDDPLVIEAPSQAALGLLRQMGLHQVLRIQADPAPDPGDWLELCDEAGGRGSLTFRKIVVRAHEELAALPGPTGDRYRPIAEMAARELEAAQHRQ